LIDLNLLDEEIDLAIIREAYRAAHRYVNASVWSGYILQDLGPELTDDALNAYIRQNITTLQHPVASAAMSPFNATWGVVDPDLRVKGVQGLRIVDASAMVNLVLQLSCHANCYSLAKKACRSHICSNVCYRREGCRYN
jgi:choline dehydrogenase-like flavoprotein